MKRYSVSVTADFVLYVEATSNREAQAMAQEAVKERLALWDAAEVTAEALQFQRWDPAWLVDLPTARQPQHPEQ